MFKRTCALILNSLRENQVLAFPLFFDLLRWKKVWLIFLTKFPPCVHTTVFSLGMSKYQDFTCTLVMQMLVKDCVQSKSFILLHFGIPVLHRM